VLSEETADDRRRLSMARVWILDPLDGTSEYRTGLDEFAVHVALWERGRLAAGAVALPAEEVLLRADRPPQAAQRGTSAELHTRGAALRIAVSRSRPPALAHALARLLDAQLVARGSAGYKTAEVIRGQVDVYLHAGGQHEWDSAAPVAVALAHGLHASRIDGSPLRYNQPVPRIDDLLICQPGLADGLLAAIRKAMAAQNFRQQD
jgi:3'(2'), 5'-bisphosphate nucleotidase